MIVEGHSLSLLDIHKQELVSISRSQIIDHIRRYKNESIDK
jgi:hypothetical protein